MKMKVGKNFIYGELVLKGKDCAVIFQKNNGNCYIFCTKDGYCLVSTKKECLKELKKRRVVK